jgi:hypothetical protein
MARHPIPGMRVKYTFDLRRSKVSGREALMELIRRAPAFSDDAGEDAAMRSAALQQTTMAGVLDALRLYKPAEPATRAVESDAPTTGPVDAEPTSEPSEKEPTG